MDTPGNNGISVVFCAVKLFFSGKTGETTPVSDCFSITAAGGVAGKEGTNCPKCSAFDLPERAIADRNPAEMGGTGGITGVVCSELPVF